MNFFACFYAEFILYSVYCTVQHLLGVSNRVEWFLKNKTTLIMLLQIFLRPRLKIALLKVAFSCIWKIYICFILLYSILSQTWNLPPDVTSEPPFLSCVSARTLLEKFGRFHWLMMITLRSMQQKRGLHQGHETCSITIYFKDLKL